MHNSSGHYKVDVFSIVVIVLGSIFAATGWKLWATALKLEPMGPWGFAATFGVLSVVGAVSLIILGVNKAPTIPSHKINIRDIGTIRFLVTISITLLYGFIVSKVGFLLTTFIYVATLTIVFGATKKVHIVLAIAFSIIFTLILYFAYTRVFKLPLPGMI